MAMEEFDVEPAFGRRPDWAAVEADAVRALSGDLSLEARLGARAREYAGRPTVRAAFPARSEVTVDNEASDSATVVEVRAPDHIGTLYRVTRALADLGLDIRHAKVATIGHEVVDVFSALFAGRHFVCSNNAHGGMMHDAAVTRDYFSCLNPSIFLEVGRDVNVFVVILSGSSYGLLRDG